MNLIYLHGFASSPGSFKAVRFTEALQAIAVPYQLPDLNEGDFKHMTISRQAALVRRLADQQPDQELVLVGSSMGAYVASIFAAQEPRVQALVLMAPAFDFIRRWTAKLGPKLADRWQREGSMQVMHYALDRDLPIGWGLVEDARRHPAFPDIRVPTLIFHGKTDETVDPDCSEQFAAQRPHVTLRLMDSDHGLGEVIDPIIQQSLEFLEPWINGQEGDEQGR